MHPEIINSLAYIKKAAAITNCEVGLIYSLPGRGCFISENAKEIVSEKKKDTLSDLRNLMSEYKLAGVPVEKIQKIVDEVYGEGK